MAAGLNDQNMGRFGGLITSSGSQFLLHQLCPQTYYINEAEVDGYKLITFITDTVLLLTVHSSDAQSAGAEESGKNKVAKEE